MNRVSIGWVPMLMSIFLLVGCGQPKPEDRFVRPEDVKDFAILFGKHCSGCHGMAGELGPAPPLSDPIFQAIVPDDVLESVICKGRDGTQMPAFALAQGGPLTEAQVAILIDGMREKWAGRRTDVGDLPAYRVSGDDPAGLAAADLKDGKEVFDAACAKCHGVDGTGGSAGPIAVGALADLMSDQLVRRIIITGRPDLGMPHFASAGKDSDLAAPMTDAQIINVSGYLRTLQRAGAQESSPAAMGDGASVDGASDAPDQG